jgi:hypothetical protein
MTNNSLLSYEITHGTFEATITNYKEVPALINNHRTDGHYDRYDHNLPENAIIRDAYVAITLRLSNGESINTRWYSKRINYIMRCLNRQFDFTTYSLRELLDYCRTHSFTVSISLDPKYGTQIEYEA